jgi:hypothetical protein
MAKHAKKITNVVLVIDRIKAGVLGATDKGMIPQSVQLLVIAFHIMMSQQQTLWNGGKSY